ncbi:MAG: hypothetical protein LBF61_06950 [Azoarcus sp.]|jgi:hypothetical protein|nr:hypothetical protein [Azoarcus sp.]
MNAPDFSLRGQIDAALADLAGRGSRQWMAMGVTNNEIAKRAARLAREQAPRPSVRRQARHPGCAGRARKHITKTVLEMLHSGRFPQGITTLDVRRELHAGYSGSWVTQVVTLLANEGVLIRQPVQRDGCRSIFKLPEQLK